MSRFEGIAFDAESKVQATELTKLFKKLEAHVDNYLLDSRAKSLALTALEEAMMWLNKAIRDQQLKRLGDSALQEERNEN